MALLLTGRHPAEVTRRFGAGVHNPWFGTGTNIQERKPKPCLAAGHRQLEDHATQLEGRVQQRTLALATSLRFIEDLLYTIAHDLRSPHRAMQGLAAILLEEYAAVLDPTGRDHLERISQAAVRNDRLIRDRVTRRPQLTTSF